MVVHHWNFSFCKFSMTFSKSVIFLEADYEKNIVELEVGNLVESWAGNLIENLVRNWVEIGLIAMSRELIMKIWSVLLMAVLTPWKIGMIPPSRIVSLGVWIVIQSGKNCIHVVWYHLLSFVNWTFFKDMDWCMSVSATWICHLWLIDLVYHALFLCF